MKHAPVSGVQPEILRWARKSLGLSIDDVAEILKRHPEDVEAWEAGRSAPTYPQLERLAYQVYKRPLAVFFLPAPPEEVSPKREFRSLPDADMETLDRDTYLHIRKAHAYQLALLELFDGRNPAARNIRQHPTLSPTENYTLQAEQVRDYLGITFERQRAWRTDEEALKAWRDAIEQCGIFVFKAAFKQKDISGFCLADERMPIIYLNNSTSKTRQIFSLLHELAHLLLGVNGLSKFDSSYMERLPDRERASERFCNAIAAEILIPDQDFRERARLLPADVEKASEEQFSEFAKRYGVSREAILRRFLDQGRVGKAFYEDRARFWAAQKAPAAGGNFYLNQGAYISNRFAREVVSRHYRHQISLEQAADLLGIKPKSYPGFEQRILQGTEA